MNLYKSETLQGLKIRVGDESETLANLEFDYRDSFAKARITIQGETFFLRKTGYSNNHLEVHDSKNQRIATLCPYEGRNSDRSVLDIAGIQLYFDFRNNPLAELTIYKNEQNTFFIYCSNGCFSSGEPIWLGRKARILPHYQLVAAIGAFLYMPFMSEAMAEELDLLLTA